MEGGGVEYDKKFCIFLRIRTWDIVQFARVQVEEKSTGVNRICQLLSISKKTYYAAQDPDEVFVKKYEHIRQSVESIIKKRSSYGIKRIKAQLEQQYHIEIGRDTLGKLLKLWRLSLPRKAKKRKWSILQDILA